MPAHRYGVDPGTRLDANGMLAGWVFGVPPAFFGALDIRVQRSGFRIDAPGSVKWLRGRPPVLSFKPGDIFYEPPEVRALEWRTALTQLRRCVQVLDGVPDRLEAGGTFVPGAVTVEITGYVTARPGKPIRSRISQSALERLLCTGVASDEPPRHVIPD